MATLLEILGNDIAHKSDYVLTSKGDLDTISGLANFKDALLRRLVTSPGSIVHRPNYGVGLKDYQNAPASLSTQRKLAVRIKEQFELDPRVQEVLGVRLIVDDKTPEKTELIVRVKPVGYDEITTTFIPFGDEGVS